MKHRLDMTEGYEFEAIGLSCHLRDFKLAWLLNRKLGWNLVRETITIRESLKAEPHQHTCFKFNNEDVHLRYFVIANRGPEGMLVKKLGQFDYFILVEGYILMYEEEELLSKLRELNEVQFIQPLENKWFEKVQYQVFEG